MPSKISCEWAMIHHRHALLWVALGYEPIFLSGAFESMQARDHLMGWS